MMAHFSHFFKKHLIFNDFKIVSLFHVLNALSICKYAHYVHAWCRWRLEEDIGSPGTGAIDSSKLSCGCRKSNLGPLEEL